MDYLTTHTSLSPIRRGFAPSFVNYKKRCTRLAVACDKVYQLLAHGRWFSPGTPACSTTKTDRHEIAEILLRVALNTKNQNILVIVFSVLFRFTYFDYLFWYLPHFLVKTSRLEPYIMTKLEPVCRHCSSKNVLIINLYILKIAFDRLTT